MTYSVYWSLTAIQQLNALVGAADDPDRVQ